MLISRSKQQLGFVIYALLAAWALVVLPLIASAEPAARPIVEGHFLLDASDRPPPDSHPGWTPVQLPDRWDRSHPGERGNGWYRFELPPAADRDTALALYIPHFNMN